MTRYDLSDEAWTLVEPLLPRRGKGKHRVDDRRVDPVTGERKRFASAIIPKWARKSSDISEVLPLLYLRGLSTNDFAPALEQFLGTARGLSPATIRISAAVSVPIPNRCNSSGQRWRTSSLSCFSKVVISASNPSQRRAKLRSEKRRLSAGLVSSRGRSAARCRASLIWVIPLVTARN